MDDNQAFEDEFQDALAASELWNLYDTGYMSTGLECKVCGYQIELADRDTALSFLGNPDPCDNPNLTTIQRLAHHAIEHLMGAASPRDVREAIESIEWRFFGAGRVK